MKTSNKEKTFHAKIKNISEHEDIPEDENIPEDGLNARKTPKQKSNSKQKYDFYRMNSFNIGSHKCESFWHWSNHIGL